MSIMELNGGSVVAMVGKDCVAIACDLRLGNQALTVACNFEKVFQVTDKMFIGLPGLATDTFTLSKEQEEDKPDFHLMWFWFKYRKNVFRHRVNMYKMKEERIIEPQTMAHLISSTLYQKRFGPYFVEPVVAGLDSKNEPFIAATDLIGCINFAKDFVVSGTASSKLFGMAEALWEPNLAPEDLFETISQTLLNAVDRDAYSGWGAVVWIIEANQVTKRVLKGRMD
ncbi:proteasome subunit beta type [Puccinia sorghi]|uniref:Proteasome subunit beta n=1 Tax=Puccinia sorghi TaxID=27349 RepID=A0A0L6UP44_9BASI|nr:proteasome subunit beta type [Puccinia sorghi]